jgi:hypothetical protein
MATGTDIDPLTAMATLIGPGMLTRATTVRGSMPTVDGAGVEVGGAGGGAGNRGTADHTTALTDCQSARDCLSHAPIARQDEEKARGEASRITNQDTPRGHPNLNPKISRACRLRADRVHICRASSAIRCSSALPAGLRERVSTHFVDKSIRFVGGRRGFLLIYGLDATPTELHHIAQGLARAAPAHAEPHARVRFASKTG